MFKMSRYGLFAGLAVATPLTMTPYTLHAQEADEGLAEIIVTARKQAQSESVQKVPISITAVDAKLLEDTHAHDITDVSRLAPNVELNPASTMPSYANFTIRGIGVANSTVSSDPTVTVSVDGLVYDYPSGLILDTFDLDAVEIMRGPQGILQGKNSTGGAVALRTRRPTDSFEAQVGLGIGNYNLFEQSAMISGPIAGDRWLGRIAVLHRSRDGYFDLDGGGSFAAAPGNPSGLPPASSREDQSSQDDTIVRPTLVFRASDTLDISLLGEFTDLEDGGGASQAFPAGPNAANLSALFGYTPPTDEFETNHDLRGKTHIQTGRMIAEVNWDIGAGVITSMTGYRKLSYHTTWDADGTPFTILHFPDNAQHEHQLTEELRFASDFSDTFNIVAGVYYDSNRFENVENRIYNGAFLRRTPSQYAYVQGVSKQRGESAAGFLNASYSPIPKLTLSAGGRYTWEQKRFNVIPLLLSPAQGATCAGPFFDCPRSSAGDEESWTDFSPRVGVEYQATEDVLIYGSWTNGFRSGAFNARASNLTPEQIGPVDPETAESYEIGQKATFWDRRARVNVAAYYTKYEDMQRNILSGVLQYLANAATATIKGVELEMSVRPFAGWQFDANAGWTDASYDSFIGGNVSWNGQIPNKDLKLDHVPEFTAYAAVSYTMDLASLGGSLTARVSDSWRDSYFIDAGNSPYFEQDAYDLVDASLTYEASTWRASLYGKNLGNERAIDIGNNLLVPVRYGGLPRTFGLTVSYSF